MSGDNWTDRRPTWQGSTVIRPETYSDSHMSAKKPNRRQLTDVNKMSSKICQRHGGHACPWTNELQYKDTKTGDTVSHVGILPSYVNYCPSKVLSGSPPSPLKVQQISRQYVVGGGGGCWAVLETIFCRSLTLCIWSDSEHTKLPYHPPTKTWEGSQGQSPFTGHFF